MDLNAKQKLIHDAVVHRGQSVFFTGAAGTGKSHLSRVIISSLREKLGRSNVHITASTGIAAFNIGGCTLHRYLGAGLAQQPTEKIVRYMKRGTRERIKTTKALIIDEVSMISREFFEKACEIILRTRKNELGSLQMILVGDFAQLPPVQGKLLFESPVFKSFKTYCLDEVIRQRDPAFVELLNAIRIGQVSEQNAALLASLDREIETPPGVVPTMLFSHRRQVRDYNQERLGAIEEEEKVFEACDSGTIAITDDLCLAEQSITLKVGAQVMIIKNHERLINGEIGVIDDIFENGVLLRKADGGETTIVTRLDFEVADSEGNVLAVRQQLPLTLAWGITIHKSQGQTLKYASVDVSSAFAPGQIYVALSRVTSIEGLRVTGFCEKRLKTDPFVTTFLAGIKGDGI